MEVFLQCVQQVHGDILSILLQERNRNAVAIAFVLLMQLASTMDYKV